MYQKLLFFILILFTSATLKSQWVSVNIGLPDLEVPVLTAEKNQILAATNSGVFKTTVFDTSWSACNTGLNNTHIATVLIHDNHFFVGTTNGIIVSSDNGNSWKPCNNGLSNKNITSLTPSGTSVLALTDDGAFFSINNGESWTPDNWGLMHINAYSCTVTHSVLFVGSCGVYMSKDNGHNWNNVSAGLPDLTSNSLVTCNDYVYVSTSGGGVYRRLIDEILIPEKIKFTENKIKVKVYPNPFNTSTTVEIIDNLYNRSEEKLDYTFTIYDVNGKEKEKITHINENKFILNKGIMSNGIYFYQLSINEQALSSGKFIVE